MSSPHFTAQAERAHSAALRSLARTVEESAQPQPAETARAGVLALLRAGGVLCVTGAGVSTDSGIPDYRGPHGSLKRHRPMTYQEFRYDAAARRRYWARSFLGWRRMGAAQPNRNHELLADWQRRGILTGLITQNVDGLHAAAGSDPLVALHGELATVVCLNCGNREDRQAMDVRLEEANPGYAEAAMAAVGQVNPDGDVTLDESWVRRFHMVTCLVCAADVLKPDVVYFGENVPRERVARAYQMVDDGEVLLVAGTSLAVMSGLRFLRHAAKSGRPVIIINRGVTRGDELAALRIDAGTTETLLAIEAGLIDT